MTGGGRHWPGGDWQAELKLDHKIGTGLRDALSRDGAYAKAWTFPVCSPRCRSPVLRSR